MVVEIYHKNPERLWEEIRNAVNNNSSYHMEHWEMVTDKGREYLTRREVKYYFKILLFPEILDGIKIRFTFKFHEYSDPTHLVQCEYMGQFTECVLFNFGHAIKGLQVYP